jgi:hypothetical protein
MKPAPIALFTYNRLEHARQTVKALANNELASVSKLIVFSDGPKNQEDGKKVASVRKFLHEIAGFESVEVVCRTENVGLAVVWPGHCRGRRYCDVSIFSPLHE